MHVFLLAVYKDDYSQCIHSWRCLEHSCQCLSPRNIDMPFYKHHKHVMRYWEL